MWVLQELNRNKLTEVRARHEVLTAVLMKNQLFWDVMLWHWVKRS